MPVRLWPPSNAPARHELRGAAASRTNCTIGLYRQAEAKALETLAAQPLPAGTLMQRAGAAVAALARAIAPHVARVLVLAGPGNNGGDGFEAAWRLQAAGRSVHVYWAGTEAQLPPDAHAAWQRAVTAGVAISPIATSGPVSLAAPAGAHEQVGAAIPWADYGPGDLVIDALLGRGLSRPVGGALAGLIGQLNARRLDVLAVDLPSGLQGDTGWQAPGDDGTPAACVQARWTLALLSLAPGLWMAQGRDACGEIWFDDLGVEASALQVPVARLTLDASNPARQRLHAGHKGSFGDVVVVGGASGMVGAATLAARAALQAGAGRVYLQALDPAAPRVDLVTPELMSTQAVAPSAPGAAALQDDAMQDARRLSAATVVAGCGGGQDVAARLPGVLLHAARLVLDADALNALAEQPALQAALCERGARGQPSVLTPHPLEAARLLGCGVAQVQRDRLVAAQTLADRLACCVVLKGSGSVVAAPGCTPCVNPSGNAALATPGSGDVLAGWLAGNWSQASGAGTVGAPAGDAQESACAQHDATMRVCVAAVWGHGRAAELASPGGMALPASLLVAELGAARRALGC